MLVRESGLSFLTGNWTNRKRFKMEITRPKLGGVHDKSLNRRLPEIARRGRTVPVWETGHAGISLTSCPDKNQVQTGEKKRQNLELLGNDCFARVR